MRKHNLLSVSAIAVTGLLVSITVIHANSTGSGGIPQQVAELQQQLLSLQSTVSTQGKEIENLKQGYTTLNNGLQTIVAAQGSIEQEQQSTDQAIQWLQSSQGDIYTKVHNVEAAQSDLESEQEQVAEQLPKLQQTVTALQSQTASGDSSGSGGQPPVTQTSGYDVQGTLVDANGRLFNTDISLVDSNGNVYHTGFDSVGNFDFHEIPNGTYSFKIGMPGLDLKAPVVVTVKGSNVTNVQAQCTEVTYSITGIATSNNSPLVNQKVIIGVGQGYYGGMWGYTDANGSFTITGLLPGTYPILIGADPHSSNIVASALASGTVIVSDADVTGVHLCN